jgi:hypothetical protein
VIAFLGITLMSGVLSAFNGAISLAPFEVRMIEFMIVEDLKLRVKNAASSVIAKCWKLHKVCFNEAMW